MALGILEALDFDRYVSLSEKEMKKSAVACNDAFVLAMAKAVKRGREKVKPGTFVDLTPAINAYRLRGEVLMSSCGSPAAMCMEAGGSSIGAEAMK